VGVAAPGGTRREIGMWRRLVRLAALDSLVQASMLVASEASEALEAADGVVLPVVRGPELLVVGEDVVLPGLLWFVLYESIENVH
jgi:hypothetical protein